MVKEIQLRINLVEERMEEILLHKSSKVLGIDKNLISAVKVLRKSIDARKKKISYLIIKLLYILRKKFLKNQTIFLNTTMFLMPKKFILLVLVLQECTLHFVV